jgi:hypothetical protein
LWLCWQFAANRSPGWLNSLITGENTAKFTDFGLEISQGAPDFGRKFNRLPTEFPSHQSRENLLAIREPEAGNSESDPNNRDSLFAATQTLRPQVLVKRKQGRRCLPRLVGMSVIGTKQTCTPSRRDVWFRAKSGHA